MDTTLAREKPSLRGVPDILGVLAAIPAAFILILQAQPGSGTLGAAVYGPSLVFLLAASTAYHVPNWSPVARRWMRRLDHSAIFLLIAGTYTPICLQILPPEPGHTILALVWAFAGVGIAVALLWPGAPRAINVVLGIGMGSIVLAFGKSALMSFGVTELALLGSGGLVYSGGAIAYATRWPDPVPTVFGYHEVFHTAVLIAAVFHFILIWRVVV